MQIKELKHWATHANDLSRECIAVEPTSLDDIVANCESSICLPYGLDVLNCAYIYSALSRVASANEFEVITKGGHGRKVGTISSGFDIYNFQTYVVAEFQPPHNMAIEHRPSGSFLYWDFDGDYCVLAGSKQLCDKAYPCSYEVMKQHYLELMFIELEDEKKFKQSFSKLTKNFGK